MVEKYTKTKAIILNLGFTATRRKFSCLKFLSVSNRGGKKTQTASERDAPDPLDPNWNFHLQETPRTREQPASQSCALPPPGPRLFGICLVQVHSREKLRGHPGVSKVAPEEEH